LEQEIRTFVKTENLETKLKEIFKGKKTVIFKGLKVDIFGRKL